MRNTLWHRSLGQIYEIVSSQVKDPTYSRRLPRKLVLGPYRAQYKQSTTPIRRCCVPQRLRSNEDRMIEQRLHRDRRHSLTLSSASPSAHALNVPWNKRCSIFEPLPVTLRIESLNHSQSTQLRVEQGSGYALILQIRLYQRFGSLYLEHPVDIWSVLVFM